MKGGEVDASQLNRLYERGWQRGMARMTLMMGAERRRRWSLDDRERILAAANAPGAVVADVGRQWDVCTSLIYKWRRAARDAAHASGFVPVIVADKLVSGARDLLDSTILVEVNGARITIGAGAAPALVAAALKALRA